MRARSGARSASVTLAIAALLLTRCGGQSDAVELAFTSTPRTVTLGQPFSVGVQARDRSGHGTGTTQGGELQVEISLSLAAAPHAAAFGQPSPIADHNGNATFSGLTLDVPGDYTLMAFDPGVAAIAPVTSPLFSVVAGSEHQALPGDDGF
jgi:hypothetical protein